MTAIPTPAEVDSLRKELLRRDLDVAALRSRIADLEWDLSELRDKLRVSDELNEALGDANVLSVENEKLRESRDLWKQEFSDLCKQRIDIIKENLDLHTRLARISPVFEAAKAWRRSYPEQYMGDVDNPQHQANERLCDAIDAVERAPACGVRVVPGRKFPGPDFVCELPRDHEGEHVGQMVAALAEKEQG